MNQISIFFNEHIFTENEVFYKEFGYIKIDMHPFSYGKRYCRITNAPIKTSIGYSFESEQELKEYIDTYYKS